MKVQEIFICELKDTHLSFTHPDFRSLRAIVSLFAIIEIRTVDSTCIYTNLVNMKLNSLVLGGEVDVPPRPKL